MMPFRQVLGLGIAAAHRPGRLLTLRKRLANSVAPGKPTLGAGRTRVRASGRLRAVRPSHRVLVENPAAHAGMSFR
jgi:hypothetical protein